MPGSEVIYMFAMSLDGFIARPDGSVDWLENFPANADFDFDSFLDSLDAIVMGRTSYEQARREGAWHYGRWPCAVATSRPIEDAPEGVQAVHGGPHDLLENLRGRGRAGRVWMFGGGDLARQFISEGLLDTIEVGTIPVILGEGIPAFTRPAADAWLDLDFAKPLGNGAVHSRYRVRREAS